MSWATLLIVGASLAGAAKGWRSGLAVAAAAVFAASSRGQQADLEELILALREQTPANLARKRTNHAD